MNSNKPRISVLMPIYNCSKYLKESIQSVLSQIFNDFELLLIDDGSSDDTSSIINSFTDSRIRYFRNEENKGLIYSLNWGLTLATGTYIARMDGDDIIVPERLQRQYEFMENHPEVDIAGSWYYVSVTMNVCYVPIFPEQCRIHLLANPPLAHPTVIMRTDSLKKHQLCYNSEYIHAEDYFLWAEASTKGLTITNIPEPLLIYRIHDHQVSFKKKNIQEQVVNKIRNWYASIYFKSVIADKETIYFNFMSEQTHTFTEYQLMKKLADAMINYNKKCGSFNQEILTEFLNKKLNKIASFIFMDKDFEWKIIDIPCLLFDSRFKAIADFKRMKRIFKKAITF
jgi:glycosyltransferase involved in cell wall biosynthesis